MVDRTVGGAKGIPAVKMEVDFTKSQTSIHLEHHMIHEGLHYEVSGFETLALDEVYYVKLETSSDETHLVVFAQGTAGIEVALYEDASGGMTGGTDMPPINNNRQSSRASGLTITKDVLAPVSTGTNIIDRASGALRSAGVVSRDRELILKKNSTYLLKITSLANGNLVDFEIYWYEPTDYS